MPQWAAKLEGFAGSTTILRKINRNIRLLTPSHLIFFGNLTKLQEVSGSCTLQVTTAFSISAKGVSFCLDRSYLNIALPATLKLSQI